VRPPVHSNDSSHMLHVDNDNSYDNMLPIAPEDAHFGDILRCATINSRGSGENFSKIDVIVDFAVEEKLDFVFVTELKTTLARVSAVSLQRRGFFSWWCARDVKQSYNDGMLLMVQEGWAKYVQKVEYWGGRILYADFAFPGGLQLRCICIYAPPIPHELQPMIARLQGILTSASALGFQVILAGDLNGVFNPSYDRVPPVSSRSPDTALM
jgi:exonuclease III